MTPLLLTPEFFLRNALGLFLQIYPCLLLYVLPFPQESLRFSRRAIFAGITLYSLAAAAAFPVILAAVAPAMTRIVVNGVTLAGNLLFLLAALLGVAALLWLAQDAAIKKILVLSVVAFYEASQYWLVNLFLVFLPFGQAGEPYSGRGVFLYAVTAALLLPVVAVTVMRPLRGFLREAGAADMLREFRMALLATGAFLLIMVYSESVYGYYRLTRTLLYAPLYLFLILSQCAIYWLLFQETLRRKRDSENQRAMEIQQIQSEKIAREIENTSRMRHDMRHHLQALYEMLEQGQTAQAGAYLRELIGATFRRESEIYCRNFTVNTLLQHYAGLARDAHIACQVRADCGELTISPADLTVLLGNALENAIHACLEYPAEADRWIDVQLGTIRSSLVVEICNPCRGVRLAPQYQPRNGETRDFLPAEAFLSARTGGGFGLRSLPHTAKKYGGEAIFRFDGETGVFTTRIRINLHPEML